MTPRLVAVVPLIAVGAALLGTVAAWWVAVPVAALAGWLVARVVWQVHRRRVDGLAAAINGWLGAEEHEPVTVPGARHWQHLAIAANALGAAYQRRGEKLRRERPWRRQLVDAITVPALLFDDEQVLAACNEPARVELSLQAEQRLTPTQALGSAALADAVDAARASERPIEVEASVADRDVLAVASPVGDEVLLVLADRTAERRLGEIRRDFVANASHELKTPVAGIQALLEALDVVYERDTSRGRELVEQLRAESERLSRLVHDLLDLGRVEEGAPEDREAVDLEVVVQQEVERLRVLAEDRDVTVTTDLASGARVAGLREDVRLIVANLLENAIQYNRPGGRVDVRVVKRDGAYELIVEDTGVGIARQDLDRIFERFYRVDVARSRETGGTGLGLSIVRHAAQRHGGSVQVDSLLGEGSTFRVVLPIEPRR